MPRSRFSVNTELTAAKAFDDEVVIINTATGRYYDLTGSGPLVWTLLERSASVDEIVTALVDSYGVSDATAREDVEQLVEGLLAEDLVVAEAGSVAGDGEHDGRLTSAPGEYATPTLTTYTDMEALLAADPPLPAAGAPGARADAPPETSASQ